MIKKIFCFVFKLVLIFLIEMISLEDKVIIGKKEYVVSYDVQGEDLEDLIDLTITDVSFNGNSIYNEVKKDGDLDTIYSKLIDSKITEW
mgnify:CR=1 FL=1